MPRHGDRLRRLRFRFCPLKSWTPLWSVFSCPGPVLQVARFWGSSPSLPSFACIQLPMWHRIPECLKSSRPRTTMNDFCLPWLNDMNKSSIPTDWKFVSLWVSMLQILLIVARLPTTMIASSTARDRSQITSTFLPQVTWLTWHVHSFSMKFKQQCRAFFAKVSMEV